MSWIGDTGSSGSVRAEVRRARERVSTQVPGTARGYLRGLPPHMRAARWLILCLAVVSAAPAVSFAAVRSTGKASRWPAAGVRALHPSASDTAPSPPAVTPTGVSPQPTLPDEVEIAARSPNFSSTWGGDVVHPDGTITAYVKRGGEGPLATALAKSVGPQTLGYQIIPVTHSYADLDALTTRIIADDPSLSAAGISIVQEGPDPGSNKVHIQLANYSDAAASALDAKYGSDWITVGPAEPPYGQLIPAGRSNSSAPWSGGLPLFYSNNKNYLCTLNLNWRGNNSGHDFNATAGHCGRGSFWTNYDSDLFLGSTSTDYWTTSTNDVQSISCNCGTPYVWYAQNATHTVYSWANFGPGQQVTVDGFASGEQPNFSIDWTDQCRLGAFWTDGYTRCHITQAYNGSRLACYEGDSGGPVYQRAANNYVYGAGLLVAGDSSHHYCYYFDIGHLLSLVNGSLITSG